MKKFNILMIIFITIFTLCSCNKDNKVEEPIVQEKLQVCEHSYTSNDVLPTKLEQGHTLFECSLCGDSYKTDFTGLFDGKEVDKFKEYNVLFIGNSHTFYNNLWDIFKSIAAGEGIIVNVDSVTFGSYTLEQHANPNDTYGAMVEDKLNKNKYDFVIINELTVRIIHDVARFYDGVRDLKAKVDKNGAKLVLYETWSRKEGSLEMQMMNLNFDTMTQRVIAAFTAISEELNVPVARAGEAFYNVGTNHPEIELYNLDLAHASYAGSYMAALIQYSLIFGYSPIGINFNAKVLTENDQKVIEQAAYDAVFGDSILRDEFRTYSIGISSK